MSGRYGCQALRGLHCTCLADLVAPLGSMSIFSSRAEMTPAGLAFFEKHLELPCEILGGFWVRKENLHERFCHHKEQALSNPPVKALREATTWII